MPYQITAEPHFLRIALSGALTLADLRGALLELNARDAVAEHTPPRLTDLRFVESSEVKADNVMAAAEARKAQRFRNPFRSAILAPDPARYGYARMFQIMNTHPDITVEVFTDEAAAIAWLKAGPADVRHSS